MPDLDWCPFCKLPMMKLSQDKKRRPYAICEACRTTMFFKQQAAYNRFLQMTKDTEAKGEEGMMEMIGEKLGMVKPPPAPPAVRPAEEQSPAKQEAKT